MSAIVRVSVVKKTRDGSEAINAKDIAIRRHPPRQYFKIKTQCATSMSFIMRINFVISTRRGALSLSLSRRRCEETRGIFGYNVYSSVYFFFVLFFFFSFKTNSCEIKLADRFSLRFGRVESIFFNQRFLYLNLTRAFLYFSLLFHFFHSPIPIDAERFICISIDWICKHSRVSWNTTYRATIFWLLLSLFEIHAAFIGKW